MFRGDQFVTNIEIDIRFLAAIDLFVTSMLAQQASESLIIEMAWTQLSDRNICRFLLCTYMIL